MNWRETPLIRPLIFLVLGIVVTSYFPVFSPFVYLCGLLIFAIVALGLQFHLINLSSQKYIGALIAFIFFQLGCFISSIQVSEHNPTHISNLSIKEFQCIGEVCSSPKINSKVQVHVSLNKIVNKNIEDKVEGCLLYTSPSPRDRTRSRMPSSA